MSPVLHPLANGFPEPWASEWGEDRFGPFVCFSVGEVVQRMRWIRAGSFWMGSPEEEKGRYDDETRHKVELTKGFWLADTPVTQALWEAVMGQNPSRFQEPKQLERPVEQVSWEDCKQFFSKLEERVQWLGARFPTEAEWEYACRAGTEAATWAGDLDHVGTKSTVLDPIAWYSGNSGNTTHPVGEKEPNPWGLHDMLGNVWEWCEDSTDFPVPPHERAQQVDPLVTAGTLRVLRGGSWDYHARDVRAAYRYAGVPGFRFDYIGLRLARGLAPSQGAEPQTR